MPFAREAISAKVRAAFQIPTSAICPVNAKVVVNRAPVTILETDGVLDVVFVAVDPPFK
jgi:hypothetical protein